MPGRIETPDKQYGELFYAVQEGDTFVDSKTFCDVLPMEDVTPAQIKDEFLRRKDMPDFDIKRFVEEFFVIPDYIHENHFAPEGATIQEHIENMWGVLAQHPSENEGSRIGLRNKTYKPGKRFNETFYWDSFFAMQGLAEAGRWDEVEGMVENFSDLIHQYGHIPNGTRTYLLSRSQPPLFAAMVNLLAEHKGESALTKFLPALQREYRFWMRGEAGISQTGAEASVSKRVVRLSKDFDDYDEPYTILNRHYDASGVPRPEAYKEDIETLELARHYNKELVVDDAYIFRAIRGMAELGWDMTSRAMADGMNLHTANTLDIIPVDLNCHLYTLEKTIAKALSIKAYRYAPDSVADNPYIQQANRYEALAERRKRAINKYCWDEERQMYCDYNFVKQCPTGIDSAAALTPLYVGLADCDKADKTARRIEQDFLVSGGLRTTLNETGQQWDGDMGWSPLHVMAIEGLGNYGKDELATVVRDRWVSMIEDVFSVTREIFEKYNVRNREIGGGGEYVVQPGFGWTNGGYLWMKNWFPNKQKIRAATPVILIGRQSLQPLVEQP